MRKTKLEMVKEMMQPKTKGQLYVCEVFAKNSYEHVQEIYLNWLKNNK